MTEPPAPHDGAHDELCFTRTFDAPRSLVFECMTDPDHLTHFWGPTGTSAPRAQIRVDARPGGDFETLMVNDADGNEYRTRAVYDEVRPPELLAWTETHSGMRVRIEFLKLAPDRTEVRIRQTRVPEPLRAPEAQAGFSTALDRFAAYLAGLAGRPDAAPRRERNPP